MNLTFCIAASVAAVFVCLVAVFPNLCIGALNLVRSRSAREPYVYGPTPRLVVLAFTGGFASMFVACAGLSFTSFSVTDSEGTYCRRPNVAVGAAASTEQSQAVYK